MDLTIKPFLCETIDKASLRNEWERWFRSFTLYLDAEEITETVKKKSKLLHLGGPELQEVIFNIPGALVDYDKATDNDVFKILVNKLNDYFSPKRNSTFERHLFRNLKPAEGEDLNKFILKLRQQATKCSFGTTKTEVQEIALKDRIIDSWAPIDLKKKLLEKEQSLDEIIDVCRIYEQINKHSQSMLKGLGETINKVSSGNWKHISDEECGRCGRKGHGGNNPKCPAKNAKCNKCSLIGHFAIKCKTKGKKRNMSDNEERLMKRKRFEPSRVRCVEDEDSSYNDENKIQQFDCFKIEDGTIMNEVISCRIGGHLISMIIDSGSRFNLLSEKDWMRLQQNKAVLWNISTQTKNKFRAYAANQLLKILYVFEAPISVGRDNEIIAPFYVIENGNQSLLGRETAVKLQVLKLGLNVNKIEIQKPFPKIKDIKIKLSINEAVKPVQQPLRRVPVALEKKVDDKLEEALAQDIIEQVFGPSPWISPVVLVFKGDGDIRFCIDMRRANIAIQRENFPLPTFETFMTKLKGAKYFTRLDLKSAFHQIELEESSRYITTFITHKGLFRYKRLLFGINSAPEIFQRTLENLLAPCKNALNYIDDLIIFGSTEEEHDKASAQVLKILENYNILLNDAKCIWKVKTLQFLGHVLSSEGIQPDPEKVKTILEFRAPTTKEETRSFLGLATYLGKFIPDLATITEPLRKLVKNDVKFTWGTSQENSFQHLKKSLANISILSYFDHRNRTRLIADASPVALGAVLLQFRNNEPHVISFASKSLSQVEQRYSQTEKESLALVWAVERFYYYLAGLEFELVTDHKPLEAIFKPTSKPPARIERWLLRLQSFKFKVIYQSGKSNIADSVSRLCKIQDTISFDRQCEENIFQIVEHAAPAAVKISEISKCGSTDEEILSALSHVKNDSWSSDISNKFYPFRLELSSVGNILLRGNKIVIPTGLRTRLLDLAHEGHPGETVMKRRVRSKVWWPLIDREVEKFVKRCRDCLIVSQPSNQAPMIRHQLPNGPWQCVAVDLLGPLPTQEYIMVLIDYYSRYQEIKFLRKITSEVIIGVLEEIFSRLGYPRSIRGDNGPQFISAEFKSYCKNNNINMTTSPPYWAQANGEVENMNRSLVKRLQIAHANKIDYKKEIQKFILMYNVTPHGTTGSPPSELLFNRVIRDKIPDIRDITDDIIDSEARDLDQINKQKGKEREDKNRNAKESDIKVGDKVLLRNVVFPHKLTPNFGLTEYEVTERFRNEVKIVGDGKTFRRNISHVKKVPGSPAPNITPSDHPDSSYSTATSPEHPNSSPSKPEEAVENSNPKLTLKLKNIGGMWRPAKEYVDNECESTEDSCHNTIEQLT